MTTGDGVYTMPAEVYHAHNALSSSGARRLLPPSCPAIFKWEQEHGRPEKRTFDFGHAAHLMVLGDGPELVVVDAADWRTKAAKEARDAAYARDAVPLLSDEMATVKAMALALKRHPIASALFDPERGGKPEQSLFWHDRIHRRCRLDWLPASDSGRMLVADYKTTISADPAAIARTIATYGYYQQAAWNIDGIKALGLADDPAFLLVMQEKTAPYLITVVEPDPAALRIGRIRNQQAVDIYQRCLETDTWPAYSDEIEQVSLPAWLEAQYEEEITL